VAEYVADRRFGALVQVEVDALPPDELRYLYRTAVEPFWDETAYQDARAGTRGRGTRLANRAGRHMGGEHMTEQSRAELIEQLAGGDAHITAHLNSLTDEEFGQFVEIAVQLASGVLRRVTLSDGRGVLVDGDCLAQGNTNRSDELIDMVLQGVET
jgi:hypothetical protein